MIMRSALQHLKKSDPVLAAIIQRVGPFAFNIANLPLRLSSVPLSTNNSAAG